jgi:methyltransferase (TIGR00027 family)
MTKAHDLLIPNRQDQQIETTTPMPAMWSANRVASLRAAAYLRGGLERHNDSLSVEFAYGLPAVAGTTPVLRYIVPHVYNLMVPGLYWSHIARTRFFDNELVKALESGTAQYVVLGAGLDSRSYRLLGDGVRAFEVDRKSGSDWKLQRVIAVLGRQQEHVSQVVADLTDPFELSSRLEAAGWRADVPSAVLLEGVSMYLDRLDFERLVSEVASWAPGTTFMMDYFGLEVVGEAEAGWRVRRHCRGMAARGEPYTLGLRGGLPNAHPSPRAAPGPRGTAFPTGTKCRVVASS